jgi:dTDP-4-amino-4,6-dideoxygalactose transaminase
VFHHLVVAADDRAALQTHLDDRGIRTLIHYPHPVHGHEPYRALGDGPVPLNVSERLCERILSIPLYPELTDSEVEAVSAALASFES